VFINQLRHAVRSEGKMSEQRVPFSVREEARDGLSDWFANRMDTAFFNQLGGMSTVTDGKLTGHNTPTAPDADHWLLASGGDVTPASEGALASSQTIVLTDIDNLVEKAKTLDVPIRPIDIGRGEKRYVLFLHPFQVTNLRTNTNTGQWLDIQKAAMSGGQISNNPIYTGALGEYNQVVLHENTRAPTAVASTRRAIFCGAQAGAMAFGRDQSPYSFQWVEELFDFKNQLGVSGGTIWGLKKCTFNSSDHSVLVLSTYAAANA
jgi:N4-gp56 family major capsid protein